MDLLSASLVRSPELLPLDLDLVTGQVTLIRLSEAEYRRASFLDARVVTPQTLHRTITWTQLEAAAAVLQPPEAVGYIFHIGHVGSTLLSRLLGAHPEVFALREPAILRTLSEIRQAVCPRPNTDLDFRLGTILKLLSRTFRPEQHPVLKATSFVSELATDILMRAGQSRALFLFVSPETYLASILGAPNSPAEALRLASSRLARLHDRVGIKCWDLSRMSQGEVVAMGWACEMAALASAAQMAGRRVLWLDFEQFLRSPAHYLSEAFTHFGIKTEMRDIGAILAGPEMARYAKAPEHAYSTAIRAAALSGARLSCAEEIRRGLEWLEGARAANSVLRDTLAITQ